MYTCTCVYCGKEFEARYKDVKVCNPCKSRPCDVCGKSFKRDWPYDQHCCSKECRSIWIADPERVKEREAKRQATVIERYGVTNVTYLTEVKEKASATKAVKAAERRKIREEEKEAERKRREEEKARLKQEKEKEKELAKIRKCKLCGEEFMPTSSRNFYCKRDHFSTCKVCKQMYVIKYADLPYPRNVCYNPTCAVEWRKQRNFEIYGAEDSGNLPQFIEKRKQTNLEKYGVDNPFKSEEIKEKIKQTSLERYGVPHPCQSEEVKAKQAATFLKNWGEGMPELVKRRSETCLKRYGVSNPRNIPGITERIKATNLERYGTESPSLEKLQSAQSQKKAMQNRVSKLNLEYQQLLNSIGWNAQLEFNLETKWFDLYMEGHPILVEIDPTFTHYSQGQIVKDSIQPIDRNYHLEKTKLANKYGYHCIHIFDWDDNYQVTQLLRRNRNPIYARKCKVVEIDVETAREFESVYHLQGPVKCQIVCLGLDYDGELVEVMTFGAPRYNKNYQWELLRLCTHSDYTVVGGASKLFKYFITTYDPESVLSYCDRAKFSGDVYTKIGMTLHHTTDPAKIWSKGAKKITDNLLRQRGYDQLFGTNYGKGTSNEELMIENGWRSVYDCGQMVFEWRKIKA